LYKKILVPHAGTPAGDKALEHAIHIAKSSSSQIILLHIIEEFPHVPVFVLHASQASKIKKDVAQITKEMKSVMEKSMEKQKEMCNKHKIECKIKVTTGLPAEEILKVVKNQKIDLLVEEKTFKQTIKLVSSIDAKITVLTCLEERHTFGFFKTKTSKREFEREYEAAKKHHENMKQYAKDHDVTCYSKIIKNGLPSIKILEFAKKHDTKLVVLTRTILSSHYEKLHHHSTVENVSRNATCPVMIL